MRTKYCKTLCTVHKERSLNVKISLFFMKKIVFIVRIKNCKNSVHCSGKDVCIVYSIHYIDLHGKCIYSNNVFIQYIQPAVCDISN